MKKTLLLASMAFAAIAFAAPAAQAEVQVYKDPGEVLVEGEETFTASGLWTSEASGGAFRIGPAVVNFHGFLGNEGPGGAAHGEINEAVITGENVPTSLPNCVATKATTSNLPWTITTSTPDLITIHDVTFTFHYSAGCAAFGVPSKVSVAGPITGTIINRNTSGTGEACILLNTSGDLKNEATEGAFNLTGETCLVGYTLR